MDNIDKFLKHLLSGTYHNIENKMPSNVMFDEVFEFCVIFQL